jgi:fatty-acyl-CoA synthase
VSTLVNGVSMWPGETTLDLLDGSIGDVLREQAELRAEHTALLWPEDDGLVRVTYGELLVRAERVAAGLLAVASTQDRIAVCARNSVNWIVLEYACALSGLILAPFNPAWTDVEMSHAIELSEPRLIFTGEDTRGVDTTERINLLRGKADVVTLARLADLPGSDQPLPDISSATPFLLQFTSGTTGRAKAALLSQRAALNSGYLRSRNGDADEHDVWLNPVPLHHVGGSCVMVLGALSVGGTYVVLERFDVETLVALIGPTGATRIGGVPTMLYAILDHADVGGVAGNVVGVGLGGANVPPALVERVRAELGAVPSIGYGQSECPLITSTNADDSTTTIAMTVGRPVPHTAMKIVDRAGQLLPLGEVGEIRLRSPITMDGYFAMPEATAEVIDEDGYLRTGDLGSMDEGGVITIRGRARDVIIRKGENIYPAEVEDALGQHPDVVMAAVIGTADERAGQQVAAAVQLRPDASVSCADLEAFLTERIARYKVPSRWRFLDTLPLTASGKVRKFELQPLFDDRPLFEESTEEMT